MKRYDEFLVMLEGCNNDDCLLWPYCKSGDGYGDLRFEGKMEYVHILALEMKLDRPINEGCEVAHQCINKHCFNPGHLIEATSKSNASDSIVRDKTSTRYQKPIATNTSGFKGVSWNKTNKKWQARIKTGAKTRSLGYFLIAEDAARAYDQAAREAWGDECYQNLPAAQDLTVNLPQAVAA